MCCQRTLTGIVLAVLWSGLSATCVAQGSYPRVYGPTGGLYGPTQAHYQYERQYGQPWHGMRGVQGTGPREHHVVVPAPWLNGFQGGFAGGAYPVWTAWGPTPFAPVVVPAPGLGFYSPGMVEGFGVYGVPGAYLPFPQQNPVTAPQLWSEPLEQAWQENQDRWGRDLPNVPPDPVTKPATPSSAAARLKSLQAQERGNARMQRQDWSLAIAEYRQALDFAPENAAASWRLGVAYLAVRNYASAAVAWKRALHLQPELAGTLPTLNEVFGIDGQLASQSVASRLTEYVRADIRDPDRLFLLGGWLSMARDPRSREILETGLRLAGRGQHFTAFLQAAAVPQPTVPNRAEPSPPAPAELPPAPLPQIPAPAIPGIPREPQNLNDGPELLPPLP